MQAGGGSRRPGSPLLSKHLDEVVSLMQKALDALGLSEPRSCPLATGCRSNGTADRGTSFVPPDNKREGISCERFWVLQLIWNSLYLAWSAAKDYCSKGVLENAWSAFPTQELQQGGSLLVSG